MNKKSVPAKAKTKQGAKRWLGSQTLVRGLEVLEAVASGVNTLSDLAATVKLNRSTAHRLASTLVEKRYLSFVPRYGYGLGPKTLEVGYQARVQLSVPRVAREHLEKLAAQTGTPSIWASWTATAPFIWTRYRAAAGSRSARGSANCSRSVPPVSARRSCWTKTM